MSMMSKSVNSGVMSAGIKTMSSVVDVCNGKKTVGEAAGDVVVAGAKGAAARERTAGQKRPVRKRPDRKRAAPSGPPEKRRERPWERPRPRRERRPARQSCGSCPSSCGSFPWSSWGSSCMSWEENTGSRERCWDLRSRQSRTGIIRSFCIWAWSSSRWPSGFCPCSGCGAGAWCPERKNRSG